MTLTEQLAALTTAEREARNRARSAREAARRQPEISSSAVEELRKYRDQVQFKQRQPDLEEHRRLTLALLKRVERDGLVLEVAGTGLCGIVDPRISEELEQAEAALSDARRDRSAFAREHAKAIADEAKQAEAQRLKDAIEAGDVDAVRETLATPA